MHVSCCESWLWQTIDMGLTYYDIYSGCPAEGSSTQYSRDGIEGETGSTLIYSDVALESRIGPILLATMAWKRPDVTPSLSASVGPFPPEIRSASVHTHESSGKGVSL